MPLWISYPDLRKSSTSGFIVLAPDDLFDSGLTAWAVVAHVRIEAQVTGSAVAADPVRSQLVMLDRNGVVDELAGVGPNPHDVGGFLVHVAHFGVVTLQVTKDLPEFFLSFAGRGLSAYNLRNFA